MHFLMIDKFCNALNTVSFLYFTPIRKKLQELPKPLISLHAKSPVYCVAFWNAFQTVSAFFMTSQVRISIDTWASQNSPTSEPLMSFNVQKNFLVFFSPTVFPPTPVMKKGCIDFSRSALFMHALSNALGEKKERKMSIKTKATEAKELGERRERERGKGMRERKKRERKKEENNGAKKKKARISERVGVKERERKIKRKRERWQMCSKSLSVLWHFFLAWFDKSKYCFTYVSECCLIIHASVTIKLAGTFRFHGNCIYCWVQRY